MRNKILLLTLAVSLPAILSATALTSTTVTIDITTTIATGDDYLVFLGCTVPIGSCTPGSTGADAGVTLLGLSVPAGTQPPVTKTIPGTIVSGYLTAIGLASPTDVVIGLTNGVTITGANWTSIFSTPESQIAADLISGNTASQADLLAFFEANLTDFASLNSVAGTLGEFSTGQIRGSYSASTVPEPGTLALTGLLLGGLALLNRRRRAS
jgi:hypothetical protein